MLHFVLIYLVCVVWTYLFSAQIYIRKCGGVCFCIAIDRVYINMKWFWALFITHSCLLIFHVIANDEIERKNEHEILQRSYHMPDETGEFFLFLT